MATVTTTPDAAADTTSPTSGAPAPGPSRRARFARRFGTPLALSAVVLGLYVYIQAGPPLSSTEARLLNPERITEELVRHIQLTLVATAIVLLFAVPLGVLLTRPAFRRARAPLLAVANGGQAIPSIGLLVLLAVYGFLGFRAAIVGLVAYSVLPILRNTMVGLEQVDASVIDAARGMGLSKRQTLLRVELPLSVPVIAAGIRTALVLIVGTATLATFINAGGLGDFIDTAIRLRLQRVLNVGTIMTAVLALFIDYLGGVLEDMLRPRGL